jgi:serine/threonine protein kinase
MKIITSLSGLLGKRGIQSKPSGRALLPHAATKKERSAWTKAEEAIIEERYKLHRIIGEGGYGRVWLANLPDGKRVALKIVVGGDGKNGALEAERLAVERIKNIYPKCPCLVTIDRVEDHCRSGFFFYTMPLADDATGSPCVDPKDYRPRTLAEELKSRGRLPVNECVSVARRVLEALKSLHAINYIHGDVKPDNVIYVNGLPVLADIGLVAPDSDEPARSGTRSYLAQDEAKTVASDLYSVAVLLYRMATGNPAGKFPSVKRNINDLLFSKLRHVYEIAGDKDPRKRYVSADAMIRALDNVLKDSLEGSSLSGEEFAKLMKESSAIRLLKPLDPPDMEQFKVYIRNVIDGVKNESSKRSAKSGSFVTHEDFALLLDDLRLEFERRIGDTPRTIKAVCIFSEVFMEKNLNKRVKLFEEAIKSGFGKKGMPVVFMQIIFALGWNVDSFMKTFQNIIGMQKLPWYKLFSGRMKRFMQIVYVKKLLGRETPAERTDKAFKALLAGVDSAISELWPEYGKYLVV